MNLHLWFTDIAARATWFAVVLNLLVVFSPRHGWTQECFTPLNMEIGAVTSILPLPVKRFLIGADGGWFLLSEKENATNHDIASAWDVKRIADRSMVLHAGQGLFLVITDGDRFAESHLTLLVAEKGRVDIDNQPSWDIKSFGDRFNLNRGGDKIEYRTYTPVDYQLTFQTETGSVWDIEPYGDTGILIGADRGSFLAHHNRCSEEFG